MITGRGYTLLPLQGEVFPVVLGYPGYRFACPGLSARWAFSPLHLMAPLFLIISHQTGHPNSLSNINN